MERHALALATLEPVGVPTETFRMCMESDPCFGRDFDKIADECKACVLPVVYRGKLRMMNDVCRALTAGRDAPGDINRLTSRDVMDRLLAGASVQDLFDDVLAEADPDDGARAARQLLYLRFRYLRKEAGFVPPKLPTLKELALARRERVAAGR